MYTIHATNVNEALPVALMFLNRQGVERTSRNGPCIELPNPVATTYFCPTERVLFDEVRDANPFFHFFEALWILAGRCDVAFLDQFNRRMREYSDDGMKFYAPYGWRLRRSIAGDQIEACVTELRARPDSRRAVLQIWNAEHDLCVDSKDIPCNDTVFLKVRDGALHMTVCNRSNDAVWGCYGANVVQFSMLQEYIAAHLGVKVGPYTQVSDSLHVYADNPYWQAYKATGQPMLPVRDLYTDGVVRPYPLFESCPYGHFDEDLCKFFREWDRAPGPGPLQVKYSSTAFECVVLPLYEAHFHYKAGRIADPLDMLEECVATDWRLAATEWVQRRAAAKKAQA